MTNETIDLIIEWFGHIQQMATDRKTLTGAVMDAQHCLNEIAAIASDSKQFVEEYRDEQEPIDKEALCENALNFVVDFLNKNEICLVPYKNYNAIGDGTWNANLFDCNDLTEAYEAGFRNAKED